MNREEPSASVPGTDKQAEADLWQRYGAKRGVWTEAMLIALEGGKEGNKWFSLIDKVRSVKTLGMDWETVRSNAGAAGVDRISVELFEKDSANRLLAVNERLAKNTTGSRQSDGSLSRKPAAANGVRWASPRSRTGWYRRLSRW